MENGSLRIAEGVQLASTLGYINYSGTNSTANGFVVPGSMWSNSGDLYVGYAYYGNGTFIYSGRRA